MTSVSAADLEVSAFPRAGARRTDLRTIPPRASLHYTERFPKERLDSLRLLGDPLADNVATVLHEKHGGLTKIRDLLTTVRQKAAQEEGESGQVFRAFLEDIATVPDWVDREMVERGQRVHAVHLPFMGLSLFSGSLVGGAQFITAAVVTALAGNISTNPTRRIDETGMLLAALAFPGSLVDAGSEAHDSLTRVRLLHGALRHWLPRSGRLNRQRDLVPGHLHVEGEVPINQQDLAITLGVFCYINLRSLRRMGVVLSSMDIRCYVHMWRYAGYVLGIQDDLLPETLEDQEEFMLCSMLHQGAPETIPGSQVKKFIDAFAKQANVGTYGLVPFTATQTFLYQMTRYLNGNDYTTGMKIADLGDTHWTVRLIKAFGFTFGTALPRLPLGETLLFKANTWHLRSEMKKRGPAVGHGAGSGEDISGDEPSVKGHNKRPAPHSRL